MPWLCDVIAICLHAAVAAIRLFKLFFFSRKCKYVTLFILLSQNAVYSYVYRTVYIASIYEYMAKMVAFALVGSRLDYTLTLFYLEPVLENTYFSLFFQISKNMTFYVFLK